MATLKTARVAIPTATGGSGEASCGTTERRRLSRCHQEGGGGGVKEAAEADENTRKDREVVVAMVGEWRWR